MRKPIIAITTSYTGDRRIRMSPAYQNALFAEGAIGVLLPYTDDPVRIREHAEDFDAFLFAGGVDVDPRYYGEEKCFDSVTIDPERDAFELALFREAVRTNKPILGICRGVQLLNVALGGTLHQHIDGHSQEEKGFVTTQPVKISETSRLSDILACTQIMTNTFHHQAVKEVAPTLRAVAYAGPTVEAVESETHPFLLGVQWHPELTCSCDPASKALFHAFVEAARRGL